MKELKVNGMTLNMYDSPDELPAGRFQGYNTHVLIDSNIGADTDAFLERIQETITLIPENPDKAIQSLENTYICVQQILNGANPKLRSFVYLIESINGERLHLNEGNIDRVQARLLGVKRSVISKFIDLVKKKFEKEFRLYFPNKTSLVVVEYYNQLKTLATTQYEQVLDIDVNEKLQALTSFFNACIDPKKFTGAKGLEVTGRKNWINACRFIRENSNEPNPQYMTTLAFFQTSYSLQKEFKKRAKK